MAEQDRITRLAKMIDSDFRKEHYQFLTKTEVDGMRRQGASELHSICAAFVASLNRKLSPALVELSPPEYSPDMFHESGTNIIQINAQGRILQLAFKATPSTFSTEKLRIPYILEGELRAYNQEMLERAQIRSEALFFCLYENKVMWRYFEWLHGQTGAFGQDQLVSMLERIV
jgi:hypothetical protein